jgi:predicted TIM-barrel fold metal-dependent hydrolase
MPSTVLVDCHAHIFNAEDLPIDGFIKRMSPVPSLLTGVLSLPLDRLTQWAAPGSGEITKILALLAPEGVLEEAPVVPESPAEKLLSDADLDRRLMTLVPAAVAAGAGAPGLEAPGITVDGVIAQALASATPEQLEELAAWEEEWGGSDDVVEEVPTLEGIGDSFRSAARLRRAAKRFVDALQLVARHRYRIAGELAATYPDVHLFVPALVDFTQTARDKPSTTVQDQIAIHSLVSKLAAIGKIPNASHVRIHPLVGFCPYRETDASELAAWDVDAGAPNCYVPYADPHLFTSADLYTPDIKYVAARAKKLREPTGTWESSHLDLSGVTRSLDIVRHAVELGGFAGVKLYPPSGFLPIGNVSRFGERVGGRLDAALRALYAYCVAEEVPILTHAARSNGFDDGFDDLASPTGWQGVLDDYPSLRICFGHFGHLHGVGNDFHEPSPTSWAMRFMDLIDTHDHVYADVGNSRYVYDADYRGHFDTVLEALLGSGSAADDVGRKRRRRLMFGTDYWMNTLNADHGKFVEMFSQRMETLVGTAAKSWFMGGNALRWLGITDDSDTPATGNRNRQRLIAFYGTHDRPEWLEG